MRILKKAKQHTRMRVVAGKLIVCINIVTRNASLAE